MQDGRETSLSYIGTNDQGVRKTWKASDDLATERDHLLSHCPVLSQSWTAEKLAGGVPLLVCSHGLGSRAVIRRCRLGCTYSSQHRGG